jgi:hypothetical protein
VPDVKVYVTIIDDRHSEAGVCVFSTPEAAIEYARNWAMECATYEDDFQEEDLEGWLYYARYSPESDCVWVVEKTIDVTT